MREISDHAKATTIAVLRARLERLGLPDADVCWNGEPPSTADARLLVGPAGSVPDGFIQISDRPLGVMEPLGAWCGRITSRILPTGLHRAANRFLIATGVASVVGARLCKIRHPLWRERLILREGLPVPPGLRPSAADRLRDLAMSALGLGHTPVFAANTTSLVVTLLAAGVAVLAGHAGMLWFCSALLALSVAGCVAWEQWATRWYLAEDAREVVLDEVAGMSLTLLFLPKESGWVGFLAAFVAFRIFDIFKPGIHWVEKTGWPGTVVWDDVLAGLFAGAGIWIGFAFFFSSFPGS